MVEIGKKTQGIKITITLNTEIIALRDLNIQMKSLKYAFENKQPSFCEDEQIKEKAK